MSLSKLSLTHLLFLLCAVILISAAPSSATDKYGYKFAKRDEIVQRGTRTRPLHRRASALPAQVNMQSLRIPNLEVSSLNIKAGAGVADTIQPNFAACAALCTRTSACTFFRWAQLSGGSCALRSGNINRVPDDRNFRSAVQGMTCAQAKAMLTDLASSTCVEEFY